MYILEFILFLKRGDNMHSYIRIDTHIQILTLTIIIKMFKIWI